MSDSQLQQPVLQHMAKIFDNITGELEKCRSLIKVDDGQISVQDLSDLKTKIASLEEKAQGFHEQMQGFQKQMEGVQKQMVDAKFIAKARDSNAIIRVHHSGIKHDDQLITALFSVFTAKPIANFPKDIRALQKLSEGVIDDILRELDGWKDGDLAEKKLHLCFYSGLSWVPSAYGY